MEKNYVLCENKCLDEGYTKEEFDNVKFSQITVDLEFAKGSKVDNFNSVAIRLPFPAVVVSVEVGVKKTDGTYQGADTFEFEIQSQGDFYAKVEAWSLYEHDPIDGDVGNDLVIEQKIIKGAGELLNKVYCKAKVTLLKTDTLLF